MSILDRDSQSSDPAWLRKWTHANLADALCIFLTTTLLFSWSYRTTGSFQPGQLIFFLSFVLLALLWGRLALVGTGIHSCFERSFQLTFLVGSLLLGFWGAVLKIVTPFPLRQLYGLFWFLAVLGYFVHRRRLATWQISQRAAWTGTAATFVSLVASTFWIWHLCPQQTIVGDVVILRVFQEYYAHTSNYLPLLLQESPLRVGSFHFAGEPLSFYHWGCYTYPALLAAFTSISAQDALAALWYPLGTFELGLAAYVLGRTWFGPRAGYWCCAFVVALPDPTYWSMPILYFPFHRLIEASPGMAYATAAAAVAVTIVTLGVRHRSMRAMRLGILAAFAAAFFKVNIIVASLPLCFVIIACAPRRYRGPETRRVMFEFLAIGLLTFLVSLQLRSAPTFRPDPELGTAYLQRIASYIAPDSALQPYMEYLWRPQPMATAARLLFVLVVTWQWYLLAFAAVWLASIVVLRRISLLHAIPIFSLGIYACFAVFLAPNENGDPFELQHRTFLWYYFLIIVWTAGAAAQCWRHLGWRPVPLGLGLALLLFPLYFGKDMRMPPGDLVVSRGFVEATEYIRANSDQSEAYIDSQDDPWLVATALTERRSFVSWDPEYNFPGLGRLRDIRRERWRESFLLRQMQSGRDIADWSRKHGVRWYLLHPETEVAWPPELLRSPAFESLGYRVFDLSSLEGISSERNGH